MGIGWGIEKPFWGRPQNASSIRFTGNGRTPKLAIVAFAPTRKVAEV